MFFRLDHCCLGDSTSRPTPLALGRELTYRSYGLFDIILADVLPTFALLARYSNLALFAVVGPLRSKTDNGWNAPLVFQSQAALTYEFLIVALPKKNLVGSEK